MRAQSTSPGMDVDSAITQVSTGLSEWTSAHVKVGRIFAGVTGSSHVNQTHGRKENRYDLTKQVCLGGWVR